MVLLLLPLFRFGLTTNANTRTTIRAMSMAAPTSQLTRAHLFVGLHLRRSCTSGEEGPLSCVVVLLSPSLPSPSLSPESSAKGSVIGVLFFVFIAHGQWVLIDFMPPRGGGVAYTNSNLVENECIGMQRGEARSLHLLRSTVRATNGPRLASRLARRSLARGHCEKAE